jgi:hypothetical protein
MLCYFIPGNWASIGFAIHGVPGKVTYGYQGTTPILAYILYSLHIISICFISTCVTNSKLHFIVDELCICLPRFYPSVDSHVGSFYFLHIMTNAVKNMRMNVFLQHIDTDSIGFLPKSKISESNSLLFFESVHNVFHNSYASLHSHQWCKCSLFSTSSPTLNVMFWMKAILMIGGGSWGLYLHSLMTRDAEYFL